MTPSSSAKDVYERLVKLRSRLKGKQLAMPGGGCQSVDHHLAGLFLHTHMDYILKLVREDAE
jgi:hypothetical protein